MSTKYLYIFTMVCISSTSPSFCDDKDAKNEGSPVKTEESAVKVGEVSATAENSETKPEGATPEEVPPYVLKRRSTYNLDDKTRAPFWRIGWQKPDPTKPVDPLEPTVDPTSPPPGTFKVTSVLIGPPSIAVINGRAFEEGEYINLKRGEQKQRVLIRQVIQEGVWFELDKKMFFEYIFREPDPKFKTQEELTPKEDFEVIVK